MISSIASPFSHLGFATDTPLQEEEEEVEGEEEEGGGGGGGGSGVKSRIGRQLSKR